MSVTNQSRLLYTEIQHESGLDYKHRSASHAIIYNPKTNKFLWMEEVDNPYVKYRYSLVGGKIDGTETPEQALVREIQEETTITELLTIEYLGYREIGWVFEPTHYNYQLTDHLFVVHTHSEIEGYYADGCITRWKSITEVQNHFCPKVGLILAEKFPRSMGLLSDS